MGAQYFDDALHANLIALDPQYFIAILKVKVNFAKSEPTAKNWSKLLSQFAMFHIRFEYFNHSTGSFKGYLDAFILNAAGHLSIRLMSL